MRPTVLLFDIDGTLITTGGVGRRALEEALARAHGKRATPYLTFPLDGMTDRAIVRIALWAIGHQPTPAEIDALLATYVQVLEENVAQADARAYRLHEGMVRAVDESMERGCAVGLGTGNIREGARVKLARVGIYDRFAFGGFGCDHEDRVELIRRGAERGAAQLGMPLAECRVVVIGDTPKDVAAAKGIGAECVGVGTGAFSAEQLLAVGADRAFPDLTAPGALEALLDRS